MLTGVENIGRVAGMVARNKLSAVGDLSFFLNNKVMNQSDCLSQQLVGLSFSTTMSDCLSQQQCNQLFELSTTRNLFFNAKLTITAISGRLNNKVINYSDTQEGCELF